ncbi:hypothetical protein RHGRI_015112 [Rhododendron griersonianum]|uniref:F-box domain-containing protein n=1 Tax=Rhododendron griersonianum TaxID=479676 RepID=A0AAV6KCI6_9ERIC|nr:hypothetical protein RHGRI_015112 [Rhododendron griersonianum]
MSWLPAKSLVRFTCVCKPWLSLIRDSTSAHTTAKPPFLLRYFSLPPDNTRLFCLRSDAHAVYAHGMLVFLKPGQEHSVELLREEKEKRIILHKKRMALLGEEEAKKLQQEDYEREQRLLDRVLEEQTLDTPLSISELPVDPKIEEMPAALGDYMGFDVGDILAYVSNIPVRPFELGNPLLVEMIEGYAKSALDQHNKYNNTKYQFVKVLKANIGGYSPGWNYYITSQVKDMASSGSPTLNFQAKVNSIEDQEAITAISPEP